MFPAMLFAISIVALSQFAVYYWRAVLAAVAGQPVSEHILAGVIPAPGSDAIVRRAAQMAASIDADLDVVHVTGRDNGGQDLARLRQVTSDVGASWHQLHDDDLVGALIEFARSKQVTQIVVGASQRGRWQELISGGSVVQRVSRQAARAGIDVHIVAPCEETVP